MQQNDGRADAGAMIIGLKPERLSTPPDARAG
jgi:hypothetical protein